MVAAYRQRVAEETKCEIVIGDDIVAVGAPAHFDHFGRRTESGLLISAESAFVMHTSYGVPLTKDGQSATLGDLAALQPNLAEMGTFRAHLRTNHNLDIVGDGPTYDLVL